MHVQPPTAPGTGQPLCVQSRLYAGQGGLRTHRFLVGLTVARAVVGSLVSALRGWRDLPQHTPTRPAPTTSHRLVGAGLLGARLSHSHYRPPTGRSAGGLLQTLRVLASNDPHIPWGELVSVPGVPWFLASNDPC